jgi:hypothetical protein
MKMPLNYRCGSALLQRSLFLNLPGADRVPPVRRGDTLVRDDHNQTIVWAASLDKGKRTAIRNIEQSVERATDPLGRTNTKRMILP